MNEVTFSKYNEFKSAMDAEIKGAVQGFVNIGYLLKVARDTDILRESGYGSVAEFAKAEYGLTKDVVSRYIRINDRFSINGYSMVLKTEYESYGVSKLQEMLALPDEITDVLSPQMTRGQIEKVKKEYEEEQQITDIEVMTEEREPVQQALENDMEKTLWQYMRENAEVFTEMDAVMHGITSLAGCEEKVYKVLAPKGVENLTARIPGTGKMLITITGIEDDVVLLNMRSNEKENYNWREVAECLRNIMMFGSGENIKERFYSIYQEEMPEKKVEVAPVQPDVPKKAVPTKNPVTTKAVVKQQSLHDIDKSIPEPEPIKVVEAEVVETEEENAEQQVEGQRSIEEYPEMMPEENTTNVDFTKCEPQLSENDKKRRIAGYKAGITSAIGRMPDMAAGEEWEKLIKAARDIQWRAEQIVKLGEKE